MRCGVPCAFKYAGLATNTNNCESMRRATSDESRSSPMRTARSMPSRTRSAKPSCSRTSKLSAGCSRCSLASNGSTKRWP